MMSYTARLLLVLALLHGLGSGAAADDGVREAEAGPARAARTRRSRERNVPTPRGASLQRARALGLGTRQSAGELLSRAPRDAWVDAARWRSSRAAPTLTWPVADGRFGRGFGFTRREELRDLRHDGIDIVAPEGSVVRAVDDGIVAYSDNGINGYGNCILIVHPDASVSLYAHNRRNTVQPGWRVERGERIGFVGSTGLSRGPHLHFELRTAGRLVDPAPRFGATLPVRSAADRAARVGSRSLAAYLLQHPAPRALVEQAPQRIFRNVLWPTRGGTLNPTAVQQRLSQGVAVTAEPGTAIRAGADAVVAYVGALPGRGDAVVLVTPTGRVLVYAHVGTVHVEAGQTIQRGEWIAEVGAGELRLEVRDNGRAQDPRPLLVLVPAGS